MNIAFHNVTKFYGPVIGVNDISFEIGPGITGLLGANGAGKSTLMKLASGQLHPTQGEVTIAGHSAWSSKAKHHMGFSPDINSFYEDMSGREFVYVMARLHGYASGEASRRAEIALDHVGMSDRAGRRIGGYSHGMRQRIKLAQALVHDPPILLLDEPMTGIDPGGRREIIDLLTEQAKKGKTILVSSHLLSEVEQLTDSILMISNGRVIASGTLRKIRELLSEQPFTVEIVTEGARRLASLLMEDENVRSVDVKEGTLTIHTRNPDLFFSRLGEMAVAHRFDIRKVQTLDDGADAVFGYLQQGAS